MSSSFRRYVLHDWPEDRLPVCSAPTCGREIENGQPYAVLDGTIKMLCLSCATDPSMRDDTLSAMVDTDVQREQQAKARRQELASSQKRRSKKTTQRARTVTVVPNKPPGNLDNLKKGQPFKYPPAPCLFCGESFQPRSESHRGPQRFCSVSCSVRYRRPPYITRTCPACNQEFRPKRGNTGDPQVCCSRTCAGWWRRGKRNPNPGPVPWSMAWGDACRKCGRSDRKHRGQGYCPACYRKYRERPAAGQKTRPRALERATDESLKRRAQRLGGERPQTGTG